MVTEIEKGIYSFQIVLPENPLKWLNCYVIPGVEGGRNLLIDAGFHRQECLDALLAGMKELELEANETDVFFTHLHSDHTGNGDELAAMGCRIFMGEVDYNAMLASRSGKNRIENTTRMGFSRELAAEITSHNPAVIYASKSFTAQFVSPGQILRYGGRELECILTPGHTPGNMCLLDRKNKLMFTGDHVLFDISPNIVSWGKFPDALGAYLESLKAVRELDVVTALPAHRNTGSKTMRERIDELLEHHEARIEEALRALKAQPGSSAAELAGKMTWRIRAKSWEEFPPGQKWFAVGECMAHLEHLATHGLARTEELENGTILFYPV